MASIRDFPHRAVSQADLLPGVRSLTRGGAIFYFDIGEAENLGRVLAVFLAGQDHRRSMLVRLARRHRG